MLKFFGNKRTCQRVSSLEASNIVMRHLRSSCSVLTVNRQSSKCGRSHRTAHTSTSHSLCIVACMRSESLTIRDHCPISHLVPSSCIQWIIRPTYVSQASLKMVYSPFSRGKTSIYLFLVYFERNVGLFSVPASFGNAVGSSLRIF